MAPRNIKKCSTNSDCVCINCLLKEMQEMLSENLRLEEQLKSEVAFRKTKKED